MIDKGEKPANYSMTDDAALFHFLYPIAPIEVARIVFELNQRKHRGEKIGFRQLMRTKINTPPQTLFELPIHEGLRSAFLTTEENTFSLPPVAETIPPPDAAFNNTLLAKFTLHVTALNNFLKCPRKFYFESLLRVPCPPSEAAEFGSAIHFALEQLFLKMQQHPYQEFPGSEEILNDFTRHMLSHQDCFTQEGFQKRLSYGREILEDYYMEYIPTANKIVAIERNISNVVVHGVQVKGKIDKLSFNGRDVQITDYKTGDLERALERTKPPGDDLPNGGDYWRQAVFYHILVDHLPNKAWNVMGTEFDFVEKDKNNQYQKIKIFVDKPDIETVTQQIVSVSHKIQSQDFYTGCGKPGCRWCGQVAGYRLQVPGNT